LAQPPQASSARPRPLASVKEPIGSADFTPPPDLEPLWQRLLEDCLPPDRRQALQENWNDVGSDYDRYMMFLEYSSYLRKQEVTEEEKKERRKQLEPLMQEFGLTAEDEEESGAQPLLLMAPA